MRSVIKCNSLMHKPAICLLLAAMLLFTATPAAAQTPTPPAPATPATTPGSGPVYVVQSGDTFWDIANRFNLSVDELSSANPDIDPNLLQPGQQLAIPGLEGVTGVLGTELVHFGDTFRSFVRRTQISPDLLRKLNRLVSPSELYVGTNLIIPQQEDQPELSVRTSPTSGETLLEMAVQQDVNPWTLATVNSLDGTWDVLPGDVLYSPTGQSDQNANGLPSAFQSAEVGPLPLKQGSTAQVRVKVAQGVSVTGILVDHPLRFFSEEDGSLVALQGIYVLLDPGVYPLELNAALPDGTKQSFEQMVLVNIGDQPRVVQPVPPDDPNLFESEDKQVASIVSQATPNKYWQGKFTLPVTPPPIIKDWFGTPRIFTFNGNPYYYYHAGVDYVSDSTVNTLDIYAAASGKVAFTGKLLPNSNPPRGNVTIIDNGWGVYTLYAHQSEDGIYVTVGQQVQAGQVIGQIGATGHVTGPHLHFEMWVNGIQVNPIDWLEQAFPQP
jgi:murein DD-endopeptidase MepM/ murein hydrolase activator NlpD